MKQTRILQVLDKVSYDSGVSAVVMNYYLHMPLENVECDFLLFEKPEEKWERIITSKGAKVYVTGKPSGKGILAYQHAVREFFRIHGSKYKIVHLHTPNTAFVVLNNAKRAGIPIRIVHSHNASGADGIIKKIRNWILNHWGVYYANKYFACSEDAGKYLFGEKRCRHQVVILNNAIDIEKYRFNEQTRDKIRRKYGLKDEVLLGHVGRFVEQKNHKGLLDIFFELQRGKISCRLILLGDGPLRGEIEAMALKEGVADKILFAGTVDNAEEYFSAMDVFVLPSLYEGLPVVGVEAQAAGLPCLMSTNITREVKLTEELEFLENGNIDRWCDRIEFWAEHPVNRKRNIQIDGFDIRKQAEKLERIYFLYGMGADIDVNL